LGHAESNSDKVINPKVSALFVFLLAVFVYMFFALETAEAETITVQVSINGLITTQATAYQTVGELVDSLYPEAGQVINVSPGRSTEIAPNLNVELSVKPAKINRTVANNLDKSRAPETPPIAVATTPKVVKAEPKSPTYSGTATWYRFGSGLTTASTQFPKGTHLRVVADATGKYVDVEVTDYGPTAETGVNLDLNKPAFLELAPLGAGRINVRYYAI
jgi:rare lipoprotein A (peptidoglycan hydrolase)